jgi:DsbC/DsbD-like thiol-disulfide interchange protein
MSAAFLRLVARHARLLCAVGICGGIGAILANSPAAIADSGNAGSPQALSSTRPTSARAETRHLTLTTSASAREVPQGGRVTLFVDIAPKPKMHVYSPEQKDVIPIALRIEATDGVRSGATTFPKPEKYFFAPLKETQLVYSRPFRLAHEITLDAANGHQAGSSDLPIAISGTVRYQACDDAICYLPQTVPVSWQLTIRGKN